MEGFDNIMAKFNSYNRGTEIWLWHEITLPKLKRNLQDLRRNING